MDVREFPVLTDGDRGLVDRLSAGLGEDAARALAYLLRRREDPGLDRTATLTAAHIGTGLSKSATKAALEELEGDLIEATTAETGTPGRPPKAWRAVDSRAETTRRVDRRRARGLLRRAERFDERSGPPPEADRGEPDESDRGEGGRRLAIGLNWRPNGLHLPLFAARHSDAADDLEIAVEAYDGSAAAAGAVAAGEVDVGVAGAATVVAERDRGRPIVPIAPLYRRSPVVVYAADGAVDGSLDGIERLRGKRLGTPPDSETDLLARLLLEQAGLAGAVDVVDVAGEERAALRSGAVDAVTGVAPDLWRLDRDVADVVALAEGSPVYGPTLVASREALRRERGRLETALAAATAGWATAMRSPEPAAAEVARRSEESAETIERTFSRASDRFGTADAVRSDGWGWHSADGWTGLRVALEQGGMLE